MKTLQQGVAVGLLLLIAVGVGTSLPASAKRDSVTREPLVEAWYYANPTCQLATGCVTVPADTSGVPPINPYPAGTMHVGVAAGLETSRVFLDFDTADLYGATAARLVIPLNTSPQDGSAAPELAKVQVCLFAGQIKPVEGSLSSAPGASCGNRAALTYEAEPTPRLVGDLAPLLGFLPSSGGIVVLPNVTQVTPADAWQVVFNATTREEDALGSEQSPPAYLEVEVGDTTSEEPAEPVDEPSPQQPVEVPATGGGGGSFVDVDGGPMAAAPLPDAADPVKAPIIPDMVAEAAPPPSTVLVPKSFKYRAVWFLPLLLALTLPLAYRSLALAPR